MKIAALAQNLALPVSSVEDWASRVESEVAAAKRQGAEVFLMPEYAACQWLHLIRGLPGRVQLAKMADFAAEAAPLMAAIAKKHDILFVAGTFPVHRPELLPPLTNRAHVFFPDGRVAVQDKLCLTPFEKDPNDWNLSPGDALTVFEWKGWRMAVVICLDIELPSLSARMAALDLDLILVPSMTVKPSGYHRVFGCAKARAVELLAGVVAVGAIAGVPRGEQEYGGISFYVPCEEELGFTGVLAEVDPSYEAEGMGPLLVCDMPLEAIRKLRRGGTGEVWPGAWSAEHVRIV